MSESPDLLNFLYRLSRLRIRRLISWVNHGRDDLPRMSFAGIHSCTSLSEVVVKSVHWLKILVVNTRKCRSQTGQVARVYGSRTGKWR